MALSLSELDLTKQCESASKLELLSPDGRPLGVTLMVIGGHSETVSKHINKALNNRRKAEALALKRGKRTEYTPIEDDIDFGIEATAIRVVGWEGIKEEFTPENALKLCASNADICRQIRDFSEDIANFTKG